MSAPVLAVVGRVNKGKSSIIATLAEDPRVPISPRPGTTREVIRYPVVVDGEVLLTLADTPGFEEADRALAWLQARETDAAGRAALVAELVRTHRDTGELVEECRLLEPVLAGACILYVVDGARPYRANYQAEMEILRWTGRPRMALINRVGEGDHAAEWRAALAQYFSVVRDFDAHHATFGERIRLLRAFAELDESLRRPLERAVAALTAERERRRAEAAALVTELLVDALTLTLSERAESESQLDRADLERRFHDALRRREAEARAAVSALYGHPEGWAESPVERPVFEADLFARRTWEGLGLTPGQLVTASTVTGAAAGGVIDAAVGGASFLTGTLLGGAVGLGAGVLQIGRRFARVKSAEGARGALRRAVGGTGRVWRIGPHAHPNFPFVMLDRALLHFDSVVHRAHARQDEARVEDRGVVADLDAAIRRTLAAAFEQLRKGWHDPPAEARDTVYRQVRALMDRLDD